MTRDDLPYAVITNFKNIIDGVVSIFCYDTLFLGTRSITSDSILIVPFGTHIPDTYKMKIIHYNPKFTSLRIVVDIVIKENDGIMIELLPYQLDCEPPAYLYGCKDLNANTPKFFESYINESIGFGSDTRSIISHGYVLGILRDFTSRLYLSEMYNENMETSDTTVRIAYLEYTKSWWSVNLEQSKIEKLNLLIQKYKYCIKLVSSNVFVDIIPSILCNFNKDEFIRFMEYYPNLFLRHPLISILMWSICRSILVNTDRAVAENLINKNFLSRISSSDKKATGLVNYSLDHIFKNIDILDEFLKDQDMMAVYEFIFINLESNSNRSIIALAVLNNPLMIKYNDLLNNDETCQFNLHKYTYLDSITDAISKYKKTSDFYHFYNTNNVLSELRKIAAPQFVDIVLKLYPVKVELDFDKIKISSSSFIHTMESIRVNFSKIKGEINRIRYLPVRLLEKYLYYYRNKTHIIWRRLGLENEYYKHVYNDENFWRSRTDLWSKPSTL